MGSAEITEKTSVLFYNTSVGSSRSSKKRTLQSQHPRFDSAGPSFIMSASDVHAGDSTKEGQRRICDM